MTSALWHHPLTRDQRAAWSSFVEEPDAWGPFVAAWLERGFRLPPHGDPHDDPRTSLRSRLWEIADARPKSLGRWVREARGTTTREVIGHVFTAWRELREEIGVDDEPITRQLAVRHGLEKAL